MVALKRFDICLATLDPTVGSEIQKTRPVVIISPDTMNDSRLKTLIVAPMTSTIHPFFPTRIDVHFQNKKGQIALDQLRAIDRVHIIKKLGNMDKQTEQAILTTLSIMFQP